MSSKLMIEVKPVYKGDVYQFDVAVGVEEQVLRFEIAVDDVARVEVIERLDDARRVEAGGGLVEVAAVAQDRPQLAAEARLHQHVHELVVPVRVVQTAGVRGQNGCALFVWRGVANRETLLARGTRKRRLGAMGGIGSRVLFSGVYFSRVPSPRQPAR